MAKKKRLRLGFDPRTEFLTRPHDKYAKYMLKLRSVALGMVQEYLPDDIAAALDFATFELTSDTFVDEYLREHLSDICYSVKTKDNALVKITILIEHKSTAYQGSILFQLSRYISNVELEHEKNGQPLSLVIPFLLFHGDTDIVFETPAILFPNLPSSLLKFVPSFLYILINTHRMLPSEIQAIENILLQKFLLVLKNSRNEGFIALFWHEMLIFANDIQDQVFFNQVTLIYLNSTSPIYREKIKNMDTLLPQQEASTIKSYLFDLYDEGMEKGMEKGMERAISAFIRNNPSATDEIVAKNLEISITLVKRVRKQLADKPKQ